MNDQLDAFKPLLYGLADASAFLFTTVPGLLLLGGLVLAAAVASVAKALSERRLLAAAAGRNLRAGEAAGIALSRLAAFAAELFTRLPLLAGLAVVLVLASAAAGSLKGLDEYVANRERIAELQAAVRNLDRRQRVADVAILESGDGRFTAEFSFYEGGRARPREASQRVELTGRELYVDAVVCNFAYSEITEGRAVNLALPYRAFSEAVPAAEGEALDLLDSGGVPLMYRLPPEEIYGLEPDRYAERLGEIAALLRDEKAARGAGVVRSLYGAALHRPVRRGDRFTIWAEQTGGLTIKDASAF
ncbi:MAG TPA: hypothetical protein PLG14_00180 [Spirochaetales bacterium]|nr:hypothetical protein [Spirochaetales bacterium]